MISRYQYYKLDIQDLGMQLNCWNKSLFAYSACCFWRCSPCYEYLLKESTRAVRLAALGCRFIWYGLCLDFYYDPFNQSHTLGCKEVTVMDYWAKAPMDRNQITLFSPTLDSRGSSRPAVWRDLIPLSLVKLGISLCRVCGPAPFIRGFWQVSSFMGWVKGCVPVDLWSGLVQTP